MDSSEAVKTEINREASATSTSTLSIRQYCNNVHKLKRAWMQNSNDCNGEPKVKKAMLSTARSIDYLVWSIPATPPPILNIYNLPKPRINEVLIRFPHIGKQIFANLDDQNLTKCREVCDPWMTFLDSEKFIWTRIILSHIEETNNWNWQKFIFTTSTPMLCQIAKRIQLFYKYENTTGIVKEMSPLHFAAMTPLPIAYVDTRLRLATAKGNLELCKMIIQSLRINRISEHKYETPLHVAAKNDQFEIYKLVMKGYKDKNPSNKDGLTPLHVAAKNGNTELCQLIMKNIVVKNPNEHLDGMTPLHLAAHKGHFSVCELISQNLVNKNPIDRMKRTPLYMAAKQGHLSICRLLYEEKYNSDDNELFAGFLH